MPRPVKSGWLRREFGVALACWDAFGATPPSHVPPAPKPWQPGGASVQWRQQQQRDLDHRHWVQDIADQERLTRQIEVQRIQQSQLQEILRNQRVVSSTAANRSPAPARPFVPPPFPRRTRGAVPFRMRETPAAQPAATLEAWEQSKLMLARDLLAVGKLAKARDYYAEILRRQPGSRAAAEARRLRLSDALIDGP